MKSEGAYEDGSNHHRRPEPPLAPSQGMRRGEGTNGNHDHSGQQNETVSCLQCGQPFRPASREITVRSTGTGELAMIHQDCMDTWLRRGPSA